MHVFIGPTTRRELSEGEKKKGGGGGVGGNDDIMFDSKKNKIKYNVRPIAERRFLLVEESWS